MLMSAIKPDPARPFGDDEDGNRAVREVLSTVGQLSVESRKLVMTKFRDPLARGRQAGLVRDLRDRVTSRARSVHIDEATFLEAARVALEAKTRRSIVIHDIQRVRPQATDDRLRDLEAEVIECEEREQKALTKLGRAREVFTDAQADTRSARAAVDQYRAQVAK
jgi:hypothetical protein